LKSSPVNQKAPLSHNDLRQAYKEYGSLHDYDDTLFLAMLFTGFYGLLCLGEMTAPNNTTLRNSGKFSKRTSVEWFDGAYSLWLPTHKADKQFEGAQIVIKSVKVNAVEPCQQFCWYINARDMKWKFNPNLWVTSAGDVPT
jgi:hypothetical protein